MRARPLRRVVVIAGIGAAGCAKPAREVRAPAVTPPVTVTAAPPEELRVVPAEEARQRGLAGQVDAAAFGQGEDGTKLLGDFLARAQARGAVAVSDVNVYLASSPEGKPTECRVAIHPVGPAAPIQVPAGMAEVPVQAPVTRTVSEQEYRCVPRMETVTRTVTEQQKQCQVVSKPARQIESTYTTEYDAMSKSTRSVPRLQGNMQGEMANECKRVPVARVLSEVQTRQDCQRVPVTRTVTRYGFQLEAGFIPPSAEYLATKRLEASVPVCYALGDGPLGGNRIEGQIYLPVGGGTRLR